METNNILVAFDVLFYVEEVRKIGKGGYRWKLFHQTETSSGTVEPITTRAEQSV